MKWQDKYRIKKERERSFFEMALQSLDFIPSGEVDWTLENPDIVVVADKKYGVEITEIIEEEIKAQEENMRIVCGNAHIRYLDKYDIRGLGVQVVFNTDFIPEKADRNAASDSLFRIVEAAYSEKTENTYRIRLESDVDYVSKWFSSVWLHFHPDLERSIWQPVKAWWVPVLSVDVLQRAIAKKESRIADYLKRADVVWLLIVVDGFSGSSACSVGDEVLEHEYASSFDGVVLFEHSQRRASLLSRG